MSASMPGPPSPYPDPASRGRAVQRVLLVTLVLNALAATVKLGPGLAAGSLSLVAAGVDSLSDAGSNLVALAASRSAAQPPDDDHPYGHRKVETLVAWSIAAVLLVSAARIAWAALPALRGAGAGPVVSPATLLAPAVAVAINLVTGAFEGRRGREIGSELLAIDARHTLADAAVSGAVLVGLLAVRAGHAWVDPALALVVSLLVAAVGLSMLRRTSAILADTAALDAAAVERAARSVAGVTSVHKIRSRGSEDHVLVDLHVQVDAAMTIRRAHAIGHQVAGALKEAFTGVSDVVVHVEPSSPSEEDAVVGAVRHAIGGLAVEAHEVHVVRGGTTEVTVHLELDPSLSLREAHEVASGVEQTVAGKVADVDRVTTHLEPRAERAVEAVPAEAGAYGALVEDAVAQVAGLDAPHSVRVDGGPAGDLLSVHVRADGALPLQEAHRLAERLETELRRRAPDLARVTIHVEPTRGA